MPPDTRNFSAFLNTQPLAEQKLVVVGEVETGAYTKRLMLTRRSEKDAPSGPLRLDLSMETVAEGKRRYAAFQSVRYEAPAQKGQYKEVAIFWGQEVLHYMPIDEVD